MEIVVLIVLTVLGFAVFGFVSFCRWLFRPTLKPSTDFKARKPTESEDVLAAERLLEHFFLSKKIDHDQYDRLRTVLEENYDGVLQRQRISESRPDRETQLQPTAIDAEPLEAEPLAAVETPMLADPADRTAFSESAPAQPPHPLDAVDPPEAELISPVVALPRRSFGEMLAGFMERRNIRWGELASGMLIVGSAIGLVISLREELRDRIPYFSALVFMLITAAIHAAGTYTLKRWKLRNTSRGVLLIGMLLIPLNFLAACLLNGSPEQRRPLSDPLLWIAIGVGVVAYSVMSWFSLRNLFRIRYVGTVVAVVVSGLSILVINRVNGFSDSVLMTWLLASFSFIALHASILFSAPKIWSGDYASRRFRDRLLTISGIGLFAVLGVVAMLLIRGENRLQTLLTLSPLFASLGIAAVCVGDRINGVIESAGETDRKKLSQRTHSLVGRSVNIGGWGILFAATLASMFHPVVTFAAGAIVAAMSISIRFRRRVSGLLTAGWMALAVVILIGAAVLNQRLAMGSWVTLDQLLKALSHSQSGLAVIVVGFAAFGFSWFAKRSGRKIETLADSRLADSIPKVLHRFSIAEVFSGSALLVGVGWLVVASLIHRADWWDVNLGTAALIGGSVFGLSGCALRRLPQGFKSTVVGLILAAGVHLLVWNPFVRDYFLMNSWLSVSSIKFDARLMTFATFSALAISLVSFVQRKRFGFAAIDPLRAFCVVLLAVVVGAAFYVCSLQSGWSVVCLLLGAAANGFLFAAVGRESSGQWMRWLQKLISVGLMAAIVASVVTRYGMSPTLNHANHALLQFGVVASALAVLHRICDYFDWESWDWFVRVTVAAFLLWFGIAIGDQCLAELVSGYQAGRIAWLNPGSGVWLLVIAGSTVIAAQMLISDAETGVVEGVHGGLSVVVTVSSLATIFADDRAVATVCRWLVPAGVAIVALLIGVRRSLPERIRSMLMVNARRHDQQRIINSMLLVAVFVVLGISTAAISRFLLVGGEALGGPLPGTWFGDLRKDVSYGGPVGLIVATFLWFAITERRSFLAMAGSGVFQYVVLLSIVLLFLSPPHSKLASRWFINIMQAISLGMTGYGFVWLWQRAKIGPGEVRFAVVCANGRWKMLDVHAVVNSMLVLSMVVLIFQRCFFFPTVSGGWITSAGSWLGIASAVSLTLFTVTLWRKHLPKLIDIFLLCGSLAVTAFVAAGVDRYLSGGVGFTAWSSFRVLTCGSLVTVVLLMTKTLFHRSAETHQLALRKSLPERRDQLTRIAIGIAIAVSFLFCIRGANADVDGSPVYLLGSALLIATMACHAYFFNSSFVGIAVLPMVWVFASQLTSKLGFQLNNGTGPSGFDIFLAQVGASGLVAALWSSLDWISIRIKQRPVQDSFFWMPNVVGFFCSLLSFATANLAVVAATETTSFTANGFHAIAVIGTAIGWASTFWRRRGRFHLAVGLFVIASILLLVVCLMPESILQNVAMRFAVAILAWSLTLVVASFVWVRFEVCRQFASRLQMVGLGKQETQLEKRLPYWILIVGAVVFLVAGLVVWNDDQKMSRITASFATLTIAASLIVFCLRKPVQRIQFVSILVSVIGFVLLSVAGEGVVESSSGGLIVFFRALVVPAVGVFLVGAFATRWLRSGDSWIDPIRDATVVLTVATLVGTVVLLLMQCIQFDPDLGSGIGVSRALALVFILLAMVAGLLMIAVLPKRDPFSMTLDGRKRYVYAAQFVTVMLGVHVYLAMPWLLKTGILQYWPYLAIVASVIGVIVSELLRRRQLEVLSEPIFNTAALIPVLAAFGFWIIDSKSDAALTFLLSGMIYLAIAIQFRAKWSGALSMLFGNVSLWLFYSQRSIEFTSHPQLWLIPPAICVLLATWLERRWFSKKQLTAIRYGCVFVIYLSSTSEILINGIGSQLWPPLVLAILSLAGMAAGILFQVRSFLFVGASFLFVAVIAMVSHAQQSLNHVWPWWAFGILTGAGILVLFGLFEKRRNDLIQLGKQMRDWDS